MMKMKVTAKVTRIIIIKAVTMKAVLDIIPITSLSVVLNARCVPTAEQQPEQYDE